MSGSPGQASRARSAQRWGWGILLSTGGISLAFNVAHAVGAVAKQHALTGDAHKVQIALAVLYGLTPVGVALALSHLIAIQDGGWAKRIPTGLVFIAAMALSVSSIAAVVEPIAGQWRYVFPLMLDVASLLALNEVLSAGDHSANVADPTPVPVAADRPVPPVLEPSRDVAIEAPRTVPPTIPGRLADVGESRTGTTQEDVAAPVPERPEPQRDASTGTAAGSRPAARRKAGTPKTSRPAPPVPPADPTNEELIERARTDYPGTASDVPGIGTIRNRYGIGSGRAERLQAALKAERDGQPGTPTEPPVPGRPKLVSVKDEAADSAVPVRRTGTPN